MEETQKATSWALKGHEGWYFDETPDLSKLFANMSLWLMENPVEVVTVTVEHRYDEQVKELVYWSSILYLP